MRPREAGRLGGLCRRDMEILGSGRFLGSFLPCVGAGLTKPWLTPE